MEDIIVDGNGTSIGVLVEEDEIDTEISVTSLAVDTTGDVSKLTDLTDVNSSLPLITQRNNRTSRREDAYNLLWRKIYE